MDEIFETYGQGIIAAFACITILMFAVDMFVNGSFAEYLNFILNSVFG